MGSIFSYSTGVSQQGGNDDTPANVIEEFILDSIQKGKYENKKLSNLLNNNSVYSLFTDTTINEWNMSDTPDGKKAAYFYVYSKLEMLLMINQTLQTIRSLYTPEITNRQTISLTNDMTELTDLYNNMSKEVFKTIESKDNSKPNQKILVWKDIPNTRKELEEYQRTFTRIFTRYIQ